MTEQMLAEHWRSKYYATGDDIYRIHKWTQLLLREMSRYELEQQKACRRRRQCARI